jgi:hypothetical protein
MFYQNDSMLSDDLVLKLLSISMIVVDRIQRTRSRTVKRMWTDLLCSSSVCLRSCLEPILFAGIAFAVALFSHIVNHALIRFQNAFYQLHDARTKTDENDSEEEEERQQAAAKEKRQRLKVMLSRRRRRSASSSEKSDGSERSLSGDRYARGDESSDDEGSEDEIPDYLSGGSTDDEDQQSKQTIRDEKDKEAEGTVD